MNRRAATVAILLSLLLTGPGLAQTPAEPPAESLDALNRSTRALSERVSPAVVQIFTTAYAPNIGGRSGAELFTLQRGTGSGVIVDPSGTVITNNHVVDGARRVQVLVSPGAEELLARRSILKPHGLAYDATVVGVDRETDLAVLRIEAAGLPFLPFSDSDALRPGELVFAFGSPLGLATSVSMGVVSGVARQLSPEAPMIYIQTDAPINPGNSGGPLVNVRGELVGINTLILSRSGGNEGIGFAAPSNIVKTVYERILAEGRVRRSEIGVHAQTITPAMAEALGLPQSWGVVLGDVYPGGPADRAGLRIGDIVVSLNEKPMENGRQFDVNLYSMAPGETVRIEILRNFTTKTVRVQVEERHDDAFRFADLVTRDRNLVPELGILALELDTDLLELLPPLRREEGVLVAAIAGSGSPWESKLEPGDVLYRINRQEVKGLASLRDLASGLDPGSPAVIQVERQGHLRYVTLELQ